MVALKMNFFLLWKPNSATYQMNQNFIRINIMLSKKRLNQPEIFFWKMKLKILNFSFISKSASGKIFYLMVLGLYAHDLCKNAKNHIVISFLSHTLCETAVWIERLKRKAGALLAGQKGWKESRTILNRIGKLISRAGPL